MNMKPIVTLGMACHLVFASHGADFTAAVNDLIPKLANPKVEDRYDAQMQLQDLASSASKPGQAAQRAELGKILAAKAAEATVPQPARVWIVRQLEYMGAGEAVTALAQLLGGPDAELRECARRALEKNPDPQASDTLRAALQKGGDATWKIGLINALGERRDGAAVNLIAPHLNDNQVAWAAALALGKIANAAAVAALWPALGKQSAAAEGLIEAANRLLAQGDTADAKAVYQRTFSQGTFTPVRAAALVGLAKADPATASPLVTAALQGSEPKLLNAAIVAAPLALGQGYAPILMSLFSKLSGPAKAQVLGVVDASVEKQAIGALAEKEDLVRLAALEALGRIGAAASVPPLLQAATSDARAEKTAAEAALARISGPGALAALESNAGQGDAALRVAAINVLAARKHAPALPALVKYASEPTANVSKAALAALGKIGADAEVENVAKLALKQKNTDAFNALEGIASRVKDKAGAAKKLAALAGNDPDAQASLLESFAALGGSDAFAAVSKLLNSGNVTHQSNAIRALGSWPDLGAAKALLALAANPATKPAQHVMAMQAVARLVKSLDSEPAETRADVALAALDTAQGDDGKKLALSTLGSVPHPKVIAALKPLLGDLKFKNDAGVAAITLAELLNKTDRKAAKALAQDLKTANLTPDITRRADKILSR